MEAGFIVHLFGRHSEIDCEGGKEKWAMLQSISS